MVLKKREGKTTKIRKRWLTSQLVPTQIKERDTSKKVVEGGD